MVKIQVSVASVSGEDEYTYGCMNVAAALKFLERTDHEGSSVSLRIDVDNSEQVYNMLNTLEIVENNG